MSIKVCLITNVCGCAAVAMLSVATITVATCSFFPYVLLPCTRLSWLTVSFRAFVIRESYS